MSAGQRIDKSARSCATVIRTSLDRGSVPVVGVQHTCEMAVAFASKSAFAREFLVKMVMKVPRALSPWADDNL